MSTASVMRLIRESAPVEAAAPATGKRRRPSKPPAPVHEQLVKDVKAYAAAESAQNAKKSGAFVPPKPSKRAKAVLDKLLKRQRR